MKNLITMIYTAMLLVFPITPWADHHATSEPLFFGQRSGVVAMEAAVERWGKQGLVSFPRRFSQPSRA